MKLLSILYLVALAVAGWRLYGLGWRRRVKLACGILLVTLAPLSFMIPAFFHPERPFADLLMATGIGMIVAGVALLLVGAGAAFLWDRLRR